MPSSLGLAFSNNFDRCRQRCGARSNRQRFKDRAQNARSEALNLMRNRKGHLPNIMVVTAEPTPSRLASIALGTGDIDCVYHFALYELQATLKELGMDDSTELLAIMVDGKRLKDISDLPLDLAT